MPDQFDSDVRIASRINQALWIIYVDLGQHCPGCEIERRRISGNRAFEYSIGKFLETQSRRGTIMDERIRSFWNVDIDTQFIYFGKREDRATTLAVPSSSLGSSRRDQPRGLVNSKVPAAGADQRPRIGESARDYSIERGNDFCVPEHGLQGLNRGLGLTILGVGHIDVLL